MNRYTNQAFGENALKNRKVQRCFEKFRFGDFSVQNEPLGRPKTYVKNDTLKTKKVIHNLFLCTGETIIAAKYCQVPYIYKMHKN